MKSITWIGKTKRYSVLLLSEEKVNFVITDKESDGEPVLSVHLGLDDVIGISEILSDASYSLEIEKAGEVNNG